MESIQKLLDIMKRLRDRERGCPWDLEQDFSTIAPYTIEEAYEVADAIEREDMGDLRDELGDLLFQVVFYAQMADEEGHFNFDDVASAINEKMLRRHPHVFGDETDRSQTTIKQNWERIKAAERAVKSDDSVLAGVAKALPALKRAQKLGKRAATVGFDWPDRKGVHEKIQEELAELEQAVGTRDRDDIEEEFGDLLFAVVNLARHLKVDPENALRRANDKFERRFRTMEADIDASGRQFRDFNLEGLDRLWRKAKKKLG